MYVGCPCSHCVIQFRLRNAVCLGLPTMRRKCCPMQSQISEEESRNRCPIIPLVCIMFNRSDGFTAAGFVNDNKILAWNCVCLISVDAEIKCLHRERERDISRYFAFHESRLIRRCNETIEKYLRQSRTILKENLDSRNYNGI